MVQLQSFSVPQIHVHAAGKAWIEASDGTHDINALKFVRSVLLKNGSVLHRIFIRAGRAIHVARIGIPRRWRIRMVIRDLSIADHHVMREHAANSLMESA